MDLILIKKIMCPNNVRYNHLTSNQMQLSRNTIYALHGYHFQKGELRNYFWMFIAPTGVKGFQSKTSCFLLPPTPPVAFDAIPGVSSSHLLGATCGVRHRYNAKKKSETKVSDFNIAPTGVEGFQSKTSCFLLPPTPSVASGALPGVCSSHLLGATCGVRHRNKIKNLWEKSQRF